MINLTKDQQNYIEHEVRIRLMEDKHQSFEKRFDKLEAKIDSQFHWILGTILGLIGILISMFGGIALHMAKLI